jgi:hypothetical protein
MGVRSLGAPGNWSVWWRRVVRGGLERLSILELGQPMLVVWRLVSATGGVRASGGLRATGDRSKRPVRIPGNRATNAIDATPGNRIAPSELRRSGDRLRGLWVEATRLAAANADRLDVRETERLGVHTTNSRTRATGT